MYESHKSLQLVTCEWMNAFGVALIKLKPAHPTIATYGHFAVALAVFPQSVVMNVSIPEICDLPLGVEHGRESNGHSGQ